MGPGGDGPSGTDRGLPGQGRSARGRRRGGAGVTLLELLLVMAIVASLAGIGVPVYLQARERAANVKAIGDIVILQREIEMYAAFEGDRYPASLDTIGRGFLRDPWGNLYQYLNFDDVKGKGKMRKDRFLVPLNSRYDLYSMGKDGQTTAPLTAKASRDDIVRANDGAFIGLASEY